MKIWVKPVTDFPQRRKLPDQLPRATDQRADSQADERARAKMRIDPITDRNPSNDRAEIEITRRHSRGTEHIFRVQHSHHQRCERDHQHEWPHDPGKQNRELGFIRRPTSPSQQVHQLRREHDAEQRNRAHETAVAWQPCSPDATPIRRLRPRFFSRT